MRHLPTLVAAITLVAVPTFSAPQAQNRAPRVEARQDIDRLIQDINSLENQPAAKRAGAAEAARQAAVPPARFLTPPKDQPKAGLAGLFLAQEIGKSAKKDPDDLLKARVEGKTWIQIAQENNQNLTTLERKLTRIHEAMLAPDGNRARANDRAATTTDSTVNRNQATVAGGDNAFGTSIKAVNDLGQEQDARRSGLNAIARETGLSRQQVEQAADQHKEMGLGDLFVAQQLAVQTKKSVADLWSAHLSPKSWEAIAQENGANANQLERQLARIEDTMRGRAPRDAQRVREREQSVNTANNSSPAVFDQSTFERTIQSVNTLGQNANARRAGLNAVSRETTVPLSQVEQAEQQNRNLGLGDLFVAQALSARTRKSIDELWKQHLSPQTWSQIARDNNVDPGELQRKLTRIEETLRNSQ